MEEPEKGLPFARKDRCWSSFRLCRTQFSCHLWRGALAGTAWTAVPRAVSLMVTAFLPQPLGFENVMKSASIL